jgi:hypothetical protein
LRRERGWSDETIGNCDSVGDGGGKEIEIGDGIVDWGTAVIELGGFTFVKIDGKCYLSRIIFYHWIVQMAGFITNTIIKNGDQEDGEVYNGPVTSP